jgi:hypothetical protein
VKLLALKTQEMGTAYNLWMNDTLILSNGVVGKDGKSMQAQFLPGMAVYPLTSDTVQLTLQVSNFKHKKGGPRVPLEVGTEKQIREKRVRNLSFELFLFLSTLFSGFSKKRVRGLVILGVAFSFFTLVTPTRIFSHGMILFQLIAAVYFLYALVTMIRAILSKKEGALLVSYLAAIFCHPGQQWCGSA